MEQVYKAYAPNGGAKDPGNAATQLIARLRRRIGEDDWARLLDIAGMTPLPFLRELKRHLRATSIVAVKAIGTAEFVEVERENWPARSRALRMWADMLGVPSINLALSGSVDVNPTDERLSALSDDELQQVESIFDAAEARKARNGRNGHTN